MSRNTLKFDLILYQNGDANENERTSGDGENDQVSSPVETESKPTEEESGQTESETKVEEPTPEDTGDKGGGGGGEDEAEDEEEYEEYEEEEEADKGNQVGYCLIEACSFLSACCPCTQVLTSPSTRISTHRLDPDFTRNLRL